jgi:hypothetical protein
LSFVSTDLVDDCSKDLGAARGNDKRGI